MAMPRLLFGVCCAAMVTLAISVNLMPVCLPLLSEGLGQGPLSKEQLGRIAAMTFFGLVTALLITGPMANRYPAKWFTAGGCFLIAAGLLMLGLAETYERILLAVTLMGLGGGVLDMILSPVVCAIAADRKTVALNWLHSYYCVGAVLTVLAATLAFHWAMNWKTLALWMMIPAVLVGGLFLFLRVPPLLAEPQQRVKVRHLVREKFFLLTLATIFLGGATEAGMAQWLPAFAELDLGFSRMTGGLSLLGFSVAMALGRMVVGSLNSRWSMYRIMAWCCLSSGILFLVAGFCPMPAISLAASVFAGFTGSCLWPSTLGLAADRYPLGGATMFGFLSALGNFGGIFMPWGVGYIADKSSIALGLAACTVCPFLMLVTLRAMYRENAHLAPVPLIPAQPPEVLL